MLVCDDTSLRFLDQTLGRRVLSCSFEGIINRLFIYGGEMKLMDGKWVMKCPLKCPLK